MANVNTGELISQEERDKLFKTDPDKANMFIQVETDLTTGQIRRNKIGRNEPCPCNSGIKFKKCCLNKPTND